MNIEVFSVGYLQTNCYVVTSDKQREAVVIDAGGGYDKINAFLKAHDKQCRAVLLTHGHFDHILAAKKFQEDGASVYIHILDAEMLFNSGNLAKEVGLDLEPFKADKLFLNGDVIEIGDLQFRVMHTAGHTKGSCCFIAEDVIFSGDTLFAESYGRTDFYGGSMDAMKKSLDKLFALDGDYRVLPGHGAETSLSHEREENPIRFE